MLEITPLFSHQAIRYTEHSYKKDAEIFNSLWNLSGFKEQGYITPAVEIYEFVATCAFKLKEKNKDNIYKELIRLIKNIDGKTKYLNDSGFLWFTFQKELMNETM